MTDGRPQGGRAETAPTFDPAKAPRKLNLGCGWTYLDGYLNVDMHASHRPDLVADVRRLGFLPRGHYDEILAQDVLEHLPRVDSLPTLCHWNRLLRPGGLLRLRVPNVIALADLMKQRKWQPPDRQEHLIQLLFGTQAYSGDFHLTSFTRVLLEHYLRMSGFEPRSVHNKDGWLLDVDAEKVRLVFGPPVTDWQELVKAGDDATFVGNLYREILRREPDASGFEHFKELLRSGAISRAELVGQFAGSDEYRAYYS